ncbi:MAG: hypothetical protein N2V76_05495 [Methanophagales archaeon]|nr:hypothetical protein [Methanophagales archaeon]
MNETELRIAIGGREGKLIRGAGSAGIDRRRARESTRNCSRGPGSAEHHKQEELRDENKTNGRNY